MCDTGDFRFDVGDAVRWRSVHTTPDQWVYGTVQGRWTGSGRYYGEDMTFAVYRVVMPSGISCDVAQIHDYIERASVLDEIVHTVEEG